MHIAEAASPSRFCGSSAGAAGITSGLHADEGANTPLYLTRLNRGGGTNAASFSISSRGSKITCVVPSRQRRLRRYKSLPSGKTDKRSAATGGRQAYRQSLSRRILYE